MITPGDQVVVAVSGGPDSVCLLDILNQLSVELEMKLFIAHYNHGLRKMEDESETQLVRDLAGSMDITLFTEKSIFLSKALASLEERARNERVESDYKSRACIGCDIKGFTEDRQRNR